MRLAILIGPLAAIILIYILVILTRLLIAVESIRKILKERVRDLIT